MPYTNPHLKDRLLPTFEQVRNYVKLANNEDVRFRDIRKLMSFLQRLPQADQRFFGVTQTRKLAVMSFPYRIKFPDDVPVPETEKKKLAEIRERFRVSKMRQAQSVLMNGITFGMSAARLVWDWHPLHKNYVKQVKHLDITDLDYSFDDTDALDLLVTNSKTGLFTREELDKDTHIYIRHNPLQGVVNDFPGGVARTNMVYVLLKYWDVNNWAQANEKFGDALIVALYDERAKAEDIEKVEQGLLELGTDGKAAFSKDIELKFLEAARTNIADMHKSFVDQINIEMAISVLGQNLTTEAGQVGSYALGKVQNYVREDYLYSDIIMLDQVMTEQYVRKDYLMNYGEPRDAFPVYETAIDEAEDYESNSRIVSEMKATKVPLKKDEVYRKIGFTQPNENDETI